MKIKKHFPLQDLLLAKHNGEISELEFQSSWINQSEVKIKEIVEDFMARQERLRQVRSRSREPMPLLIKNKRY